MPKPPICVDVDGVASDVWGTVNRYRKWDRLLPLPLPVDYEMSNIGELDRTHTERMFRDPRFYRKQYPIQGAKPALWTLSHYYTINYFTSRGVTKDGRLSRALSDVTRRWLFDWEFPDGMIYFTAPGDKGLLVKERFPDAVFAVDDNILPAQSYISEGILTYVVSYPYNQGLEDNPLLVRVKDLPEVVVHRREVDGLMMRRNGFGEETEDDYGDYGDYGDTNGYL